jgi:hypothetical protein
LARGAAETLDQTFAGGLVKAGVQGNKALAKQAAINAAALGTGGKAAVTAAGAATWLCCWLKAILQKRLKTKTAAKEMLMQNKRYVKNETNARALTRDKVKTKREQITQLNTRI